MTPERKAEIEAAAGDGAVLVHLLPSIDEKCQHDWEYVRDADGEAPSHCKKCGLSFTRYIYCCMP